MISAHRAKSNKHPAAVWVLDTEEGELVIEKYCLAIWPCRHRNSQSLDSLDLWHAIRKVPALQQREPELWAHFCGYQEFVHFGRQVDDI